MDKLKNKKIVTLESCQDERGGIIAYIHSSKNADKSYAKYLWRTQLNPKTMAINHVFTIEEVDDGTWSYKYVFEKFLSIFFN